MTWLEPMLAAAGVLAIDQASKAVVLHTSPCASGIDRQFPLHQAGIESRRRAGPLRRAGAAGKWGVAVVLVALALYGDAFHHGTLGPVGLGAAVGGATGNLLDRLRRGAIVDFIAVGWWPVFNLADVAIVAGAGLVLLSIR